MSALLLPRADVTAMPDSPILDVVRIGRTVPGILPLWLGEGDRPTPDFINEAAIDALRAGQTFYTPNRGIPELRAAIARYYDSIFRVEVSDFRICVTNSGMHGVTMIVSSLMGLGDNAVLLTPCWPNVDRAVRLVGAEPRHLPMPASRQGFTLDLDRLFAACDARTRAIYLATPGNPTGWTVTVAEAAALLDFARERGIAILADEVYQRLSFAETTGFTFLSIARPDDPLFIINSFSKCWSMTGWRLGWIVYPAAFEESFEKLSQFTISGSPAFLQHGAVAALDHGEPYVAEVRMRAHTTCRFIESALDRINGVTVVPSQGGLYTMFRVAGMTDSVAFCAQAARQAKVGLAPGSAFGAGGEDLIRLCHARSIPTLELAAQRLEAFINRL